MTGRLRSQETIEDQIRVALERFRKASIERAAAIQALREAFEQLHAPRIRRNCSDREQISRSGQNRKRAQRNSSV
jgi:hypothetical protein